LNVNLPFFIIFSDGWSDKENTCFFFGFACIISCKINLTLTIYFFWKKSFLNKVGKIKIKEQISLWVVGSV